MGLIWDFIKIGCSFIIGGFIGIYFERKKLKAKDNHETIKNIKTAFYEAHEKLKWYLNKENRFFPEGDKYFWKIFQENRIEILTILKPKKQEIADYIMQAMDDFIKIRDEIYKDAKNEIVDLDRNYTNYGVIRPRKGRQITKREYVFYYDYEDRKRAIISGMEIIMARVQEF